MRIISWNVNGLRAAVKKGFLDWVEQDDPDILCLQEVRARRNQLPDEVQKIDGYSDYISEAEKKGYSGVATYSRPEPVEVSKTFCSKFDPEGRLLMARYPEFVLFNVYFPNGKSSQQRLDYKLEFYDTFLDTVSELLEDGEEIIICGDVNTAHKPIDLARPEANKTTSGFLPEEREWIDRLLETGFTDTFRMFNEEGDNYSFWDYRTRARERNVGWRLDYFFASDNLVDRIGDAFILSDVYGSDHCPVGIEMDLS